jgi:hypothetical protein
MGFPQWTGEGLSVVVGGLTVEAPFYNESGSPVEHSLSFGDLVFSEGEGRGVRITVEPGKRGPGCIIRAIANDGDHYDSKVVCPVEVIMPHPEISSPPRPSQHEAYRQAVLGAGNTALFGLISRTTSQFE